MFWSCCALCPTGGSQPNSMLLKPPTVFTTVFAMISTLPWSGWLQVSSISCFIMRSWCHFPNFHYLLDFQIGSKHHQGSNRIWAQGPKYMHHQRRGFYAATVGLGQRRQHREPQIWKELVGSKTQGTSWGYDSSQMMRMKLHQPQMRQGWWKSLNVRVVTKEIGIVYWSRIMD
jgi:hypothetical protein